MYGFIQHDVFVFLFTAITTVAMGAGVFNGDKPTSVREDVAPGRTRWGIFPGLAMFGPGYSVENGMRFAHGGTPSLQWVLGCDNRPLGSNIAWGRVYGTATLHSVVCPACTPRLR